MKKLSNKYKNLATLTLVLIMAIIAVKFLDISNPGVQADTIAQTLPFSQNWSNINLITVNDDWSSVPGIIGYRGDDATTTTAGIDPRTILADRSTPVNVVANQAAPNTFTTGAVAEFDGIPNPVVALQGSGTADAPHIVIRINTIGKSNIVFAANIRDIDGSADDAIQQVDVQYRVGATGNYTSVPGGYIADATTGGTDTQVTPLNLTLPAAANDQAIVDIRVITTNAIGSDELVGVDDINITSGGGTPTPTPTPRDANVDFNGDNKSDYVVTRNVSGGKNWYVNTNGSAGFTAIQFGVSTDIEIPEDYDGDNKDDIAVYRDGTQGAFYILQSQTNTFRAVAFGTTGDDPKVVADYDGDNKADIAVYRKSNTTGNVYLYISSITGNMIRTQWGSTTNIRPIVGDYDGDNKADFCVYDGNVFYLLKSTGGTEFIRFGEALDVTVPGDFDGDGKSDFALVRNQNGQLVWYISTRANTFLAYNFGLSSDVIAPGDYDGDGIQDVAVWRSSATPGATSFYSRKSSDGTLQVFQFGVPGDYPVANWYVH